MEPSPYTPGELARDVPGREDQLAEIEERLGYVATLARLAGRIRVDTGPRGMGKTSLLREAQRRADERKLLTVWVQADAVDDLIVALSDEIIARSETWTDQAKNKLSTAAASLKVTLGVPGVASVTWERDNADAPAPREPVRAFEGLIRTATQLAKDAGRTGLAVFIDELQAADDRSMRLLAATWQTLQAEGPDVPAIVLTAGLANTADVVTSSVTHSERFAYRLLERLSPGAARLALERPASQLGVTWDPQLLDAVLERADGYPYTLQLYGDALWVEAGYPDAGSRLEHQYLAAAVHRVSVDMTALFRSRWHKASMNEQAFLSAMAGLDPVGPVERSAIAQLMGKSSRELSTVRHRLIDKGLIASAGHGLLAFTVPGFGEWLGSFNDDAAEQEPEPNG